jgi:DHA2 family multidrug resistance protein
MATLHDSGLSAQQSLGSLANQVVNQAYTQAALDLFWLFGVLSIVMIPLVWITRRSISGGGTVAAD